MQLSERKTGRYLPFNTEVLPTDNMERIYVTHAPTHESLETARFDIKSPHNCHMSAVAYLERTLEFQLLARPPGLPVFIPVEAGLRINGRNVFNQTNENLQVRLNSPGFALQNVMKRFTTTFKDGTVTDEPSKWLPEYSHLYQDSLANYVSNSGRAFLHFRNVNGFDFFARASLDRTLTVTPFRHQHAPQNVVRDLHVFENDTGVIVNHQEVRMGPPAWFNQGAPPPMNAFPNLLDLVNDYYQPVIQNADDVLNAEYAGLVQDTPAWANSIHNIVAHLQQYAGMLAVPPGDAGQQAVFDALQPEALNVMRQAAIQRQITANPTNFCLCIETFALQYLAQPLAFQTNIGGTHLWPLNGAEVNGNPPVAAGPAIGGAQIASNINVAANILGVNENNINISAHHEYFLPVAPGGGGQSNSDVDFALRTQARAILQAAPPVYANNNAAGQAARDQLKQIFRQAYEAKYCFQTMNYLFATGCALERPWAGATPNQRAVRRAIFGQNNEQNICEAWKQYFVNYIRQNMQITQIIDDFANKDANGDVIVQARNDPYMINAANSNFKVKFFEPLVCGLHKPAEGPQPGCWADVGDILPRTERFQYQFDFESTELMGRRLINLLLTPGPNQCFPMCRLLAAHDTRMHTVFYRGLLNPRVDLVLHDFQTVRLGQVSFNPTQVELGNDPQTKTIDFEFEYRTKPHPPLFMILHTKTLFKTITRLQDMATCHHGVSISQLQLNSNTHTRVMDFTGHNFHARFGAMTTNLFPEFKPLVDDFGGCVVIPLSKIPNSVYMSPHEDRMWGRISLTHPEYMGETEINPNEECIYEVRAILYYKDLRLIKNESSSKKVLQLQR